MNLRNNLHSDTIKHVDLSFFVEVPKTMKVRLAIEKMQASQRKCALVMDNGKLLGIFTNHDIARRTIDQPGTSEQTVESVMTTNPLTLKADMKIIDAIKVMGEKPYRYMPVIGNEDQVLGTLTHYALIKYISDHFPEEIYNLPPVPGNYAHARDGA